MGGKPISESEKKEIDSRRQQILLVDEQDMLDIIAGAYHDRTVRLPVWEGLPLDVEVLGASYYPEYCGFGIRIRHPSFDPVPRGFAVPHTTRAHVYVKFDASVTRNCLVVVKQKGKRV